MPRPSKGERSTVSLRLSPDLLKQVDEAAETANLDRQAWVEMVLRERVTVVPAVWTPKRFEVRPKESRSPIGFDPQTGAPIYR